MMPAARVVETLVPWPFGLSVRQTVRKMIQLTRAASVTPSVIALAKDVVRDVRPGDVPGYIQAIDDFNEAVFRWTPDPVSVESLTDPVRQVAEIRSQGYVQNDCDDNSMLTAALARSIGIRTRFVTMGLRNTGPIAHVRAEAFTGREWVSLDRSAPSLLPGERSITMEVH